MVWNEALKREIPEGWEAKSLGTIESNIITGKTPSTADETNFGGEIPFLTIDDLRGHVYAYSSQRSLSKRGALLQKGKFIAPDSLCVSCIGTVGVISFCALSSQTNQQINTVVFTNDYNREYLYFALKSYFSAATVKTGNTFVNMSKCEFAAIQCLLPPRSMRVKFHSIMRSVFMQIKNAEKQIISQTKARDTLLPLLMNGQVKVRVKLK